jgi:putative transposase
MPRHARLDTPGAVHHVMVRGINKADIFIDDQDRARFLEKYGEVSSEAKAVTYAWALMSNHVHLLMRSGEKGIGTVMRKVLTWYAIYFNRRHHRTGHLFENRYKSILVEEDAYLLTLLRYIHLNPVRAGIASDMDTLDRYRWSGHSMILQKDTPQWIDSAFVLSQFSERRKKAVEAYRRFVEEGFAMGSKPELVGGGLVRSLGGWSNVISLQGREKQKSDERILGGTDFVQRVLKEAEERHLRQMRVAPIKTIEEIIEEECSKARVTPDEVKHGGRRAKATSVRALIAYRAVTALGLSAAEAARHLGVTTSTITRTVARQEKSSSAFRKDF